MKVHILEGTDHTGKRRRSACGRWILNPQIVMVGRAHIEANQRTEEVTCIFCRLAYAPQCIGYAPRCKCGERTAEPLHSCPFQEDVNEDDEYECTCCDECRSQCAADI